VNLCESGVQLRDHATGDVKGSFARIKGACMRLEARATPSNGRIITPVLAVDEKTVVFRAHEGETASGSALRSLWITVDRWTSCE